MDKHIHESSDYKYIPMTSIRSRTGEEVTEDVYYYTDQIVNVCFIGQPHSDGWVLIDTGLPYAEEEILKIAHRRFGKDSRPKCIILTHGHFDHVGGVVDLVKKWQVPVYVHELELPYVTGQKAYPIPDATVEGGILAKISPMYPKEPINLGEFVKTLPEDQTVPGLPEWRWIHTPGHSPGHISLYREEDSLLLSADAFITVKQDSFYNVLLQVPEVHGPPRYLTTDWKKAKESVEKLWHLQPKIVVPGHGVMLKGQELLDGLEKLVVNFDQLAVPDYGRFVDDQSLDQ